MTRHASSIITGIIAAFFAALALLSVKPDILTDATKVTLRSPFAQILAFRGWIALLLAGLALFFVVMGAIRKSLLNRGRIAFGLACALGLASIGHISVMAMRGFSPTTLVADKEEGDITVLEYNTAGGAVTMDNIASTVVDNNVDVVALTETSADDGNNLVALLEGYGLDFQIFTNGKTVYDTEYSSTVLLISRSLGQYRADDSFLSAKDDIHGVMAQPADGNTSALRFAALHPVSPSQAQLRAWRIDMLEAYSTCAEYENVIIAGDFNSTADHEAALHLGTPCTDAGAQADISGLGTWPSNLPGFFSAPIDRVLTNTNYRGVSAEIVNAGESDHRGIIVRMRPASPQTTEG